MKSSKQARQSSLHSSLEKLTICTLAPMAARARVSSGSRRGSNIVNPAENNAFQNVLQLSFLKYLTSDFVETIGLKDFTFITLVAQPRI